MDGQLTESEVVAALRAEAAGWTPRRMPNLADLTGARPHWGRPVMLASGFGAAVLAVMLLLSTLLLLAHPTFPGSDGLVYRLLSR
ncbi:MAG TPA: hypothetical protein VKF59_01435 [Candidatus Dormibacteraeota bacterium]|nr:hypothetical protein [Candidatus Dormibacteraeota bacterium]